ncbi:Poly [ADP-ribose] polymerase [Hordeum vulgare]|nr:Poly [ADP-ribose] polymerase [Hordeum vulgare]
MALVPYSGGSGTAMATSVPLLTGAPCSQGRTSPPGPSRWRPTWMPPVSGRRWCRCESLQIYCLLQGCRTRAILLNNVALLPFRVKCVCTGAIDPTHRVIGVNKPGSQEEFLGIYDSGVDDGSNPNYYVIWPSHRSTNISLEYLISFGLAPKVQEYFSSLKGLWLRSPPGEVKVDPSILQPVLCQTDEGPTSPGISFRLLFETIQDSISSLQRELLYRHYEELKENKITRDEMVKKMMIIVGEKLLLDSLTKLKYSPSLWYNSPAKNTNYPTTLGSVGIGTSTDVVSATPSHDGLAPSVLRENCEPVNSTCDGSPVNAVRGQHSPTPSMCSESSSSRCTNSQDPSAPMVAPLGRDALVRSAFVSFNGLDYSGPSMEYNGHDPLARSCSKGHDSHVSGPTLGNSASVSMEGLHSATPGTTPEAHDALASNRAHESVAATPGVACQAYTSSICAPRSMAPHLRAPRSMGPELCAPRSMAPHLRAPKSMAPHLHVRSKVPKVPGKKTMPEANYSSTAIVVPVICKPRVLPNENSHPTSSKECMASVSILQGPDCPTNRATKLQNTPNLKNVALKNPAAQCGSNKSLPRIGVDGAAGCLCKLVGNIAEEAEHKCHRCGTALEHRN